MEDEVIAPARISWTLRLRFIGNLILGRYRLVKFTYKVRDGHIYNGVNTTYPEITFYDRRNE